MTEKAEGPRKIRVLIVDDSAIVRKLLSERLGAAPDIEVAGTAPDPYVARDKIVELRPHVLTLDIEMPRMDGITFLRKLMRYYPLPVIVVSSMTPRGSQLALEAMELGAMEVLPKPGSSYSVQELGDLLVSKIRAVAAAVPLRTLLYSSRDTSMDAHLGTLRFTTDKIIAIGASTGGTEAIKQILTQMPAQAPGILVVQHMPPQFTSAFADRLNQLCRIQVKEAQNGESVGTGKALIAPGNLHLVLVRSGAKYVAKTKAGPRVHYQRPSVDVLFHSVAAQAGPNAVGILLTGMGSDGARGLLAIRRAGGKTIAQDESTCVVFGMPKEAIQMGAAERILPLPRIASEALSMVSTPGRMEQDQEKMSCGPSPTRPHDIPGGEDSDHSLSPGPDDTWLTRDNS